MAAIADLFDRPEEGAGEDRQLSAADARLSQAAPSGAIVLGADYRGLGIVRSLGRRGVPIWVVRGHHTVACHSRFVERVLDWDADTEHDPGARLLALGRSVIPGFWALFPTTDQMTAAIARHRAELSRYFVVTTEREPVVAVGQDKRQSHSLAARNGIGFPRTWLPTGIEDLEEIDADFPLIVKPAVKARANRLTHDKAWKAGDRVELRRRYEDALRLLPADQIMIQDLIPGDGRYQLSYAGVMDRGRPVADVVARRLRQYPRHVGLHSTFVVSVEDGEVEQAAQRLVADLDYTGLIEIEFKRDPRDQSLNLLDINTRAWGWHTLGARSKVDFVHITWQLLQGIPVTPVRVPAGQTWMRLLTDALVAGQDIRSKHLSVREYVRLLARRHDPAVFAADDPLPALADGPRMAYLRWKRTLGPA